MKKFDSENKAFKAGGDRVAALCLLGKPNCGFRVLRHNSGKGFKVLMIPERGDGLPFYL